ncbi:ankyrin repeat-containing domain protein [Lanmaoa asiatica]|nr:ankyrin repeat-containing domain protein [Lanmaoa asiatica]
MALDRRFPFLADYLLSTGRPLPPDALFAILHSALPSVWRAHTICSLVGKGAGTCGLSARGNTLLQVAVLTLAAKFLVGAGCRPLVRNKIGETPLDVALKRGCSSIADYLLSTGKLPPFDVLLAVLTSKCSTGWIVKNIHSLTKGGSDIRSLAADGNSLIHAVMMFHREDACLELLTLLISRGCNPSARNREGKIALHIAAERQNFSVMSHILSLDQPFPDILFFVLKSRSWMKPLMLRTLINKGANIRAVDGETLPHIAISSFRNSYSRRSPLNLPLIAKTLVNGGCDAFVPDSRGRTPLHLAVAEGYVSIVEYLLSITTLPYLPADILACALDEKVARIDWKGHSCCASASHWKRSQCTSSGG